MKFENTRVYNFEKALHGMRNPKNSWNLSDSEYGVCKYEDVPNGSRIVTYYSNDPKDESTARVVEIKSSKITLHNIKIVKPSKRRKKLSRNKSDLRKNIFVR